MSNKKTYSKLGPLLGASNNSLVLLFAINAFVFIILAFLRLAYTISYSSVSEGLIHFEHQIFDWFILPAQLHAFAGKCWTIITYMFSTYSALLFVSTLLWLWVFGYILQDLVGNKHIIPIYLYGGFIGGIVFLVAANTLPFLKSPGNLQALEGGGVAVMAVAVATTIIAPDYRFFTFINGGIPIWVITSLYILIDFVSVASNNGATALAHIAAAAVGFIYVKLLQSGKDMGLWMNQLVTWINNLFNPDAKVGAQKQFYKTEKAPFVKKSNITQQKLDLILDKINQHGIDSLSEEEQDFLNRVKEEL